MIGPPVWYCYSMWWRRELKSQFVHRRNNVIIWIYFTGDAWNTKQNITEIYYVVMASFKLQYIIANYIKNTLVPNTNWHLFCTNNLLKLKYSINNNEGKTFVVGGNWSRYSGSEIWNHALPNLVSVKKATAISAPKMVVVLWFLHYWSLSYRTWKLLCNRNNRKAMVCQTTYL